jgi:hypothetical protein
MNPVTKQVINQVEFQTWRPVDDQVLYNENQTMNPVTKQVNDHVWTHVYNQVYDQVITQVWNKVRSKQ